ncbi:hypothetical protein GGF31_000571 [Allomyces arbusculus]|nr:hypothetical protein GGF31_000571 [Allomyces arbusculus]
MSSSAPPATVSSSRGRSVAGLSPSRSASPSSSSSPKSTLPSLKKRTRRFLLARRSRTSPSTSEAPAVAFWLVDPPPELPVPPLFFTPPESDVVDLHNAPLPSAVPAASTPAPAPATAVPVTPAPEPAPTPALTPSATPHTPALPAIPPSTPIAPWARASPAATPKSSASTSPATTSAPATTLRGPGPKPKQPSRTSSPTPSEAKSAAKSAAAAPARSQSRGRPGRPAGPPAIVTGASASAAPAGPAPAPVSAPADGRAWAKAAKAGRTTAASLPTSPTANGSVSAPTTAANATEHENGKPTRSPIRFLQADYQDAAATTTIPPRNRGVSPPAKPAATVIPAAAPAPAPAPAPVPAPPPSSWAALLKPASAPMSAPHLGDRGLSPVGEADDDADDGTDTSTTATARPTTATTTLTVGTSSSRPSTASTTATITPSAVFQNGLDRSSSKLVAMGTLAQQYREEPVTRAVPIAPRGLLNNGNMCFLNVILQPLIHCPPFFALVRTIAHRVAHSMRDNTQLIEAFVAFFREYAGSALGGGQGKSVPTSAGVAWGARPSAAASTPDPTPAMAAASANMVNGIDSEALQPEVIYDVVRTQRKMSLVKGRQEDAEEFLGFLLDGLHSEFVAAAKSAMEAVTARASPDPNEGEWLEVGHGKHKTSVTRAVTVHDSPITRLFGGRIRNTLRVPGQKDSVTIEPFQALPLDIQPDHVTSVAEALRLLVKPDVIDEYPAADGSLVEAQKQAHLDRVPPVLVLHLKRFLFDHRTHDTVKLGKHVAVPARLELEPVLWAPRPRARSLQRSGSSPTRTRAAHDWAHVAAAAVPPKPEPARDTEYRLFAVVYHHGRTASGGHYTCDLLESEAHSTWIRTDDTDLARVATADVLAEKPDREPYLLFYEAVNRVDRSADATGAGAPALGPIKKRANAVVEIVGNAVAPAPAPAPAPVAATSSTAASRTASPAPARTASPAPSTATTSRVPTGASTPARTASPAPPAPAAAMPNGTNPAPTPDRATAPSPTSAPVQEAPFTVVAKPQKKKKNDAPHGAFNHHQYGSGGRGAYRGRGGAYRGGPGGGARGGRGGYARSGSSDRAPRTQ